MGSITLASTALSLCMGEGPGGGGEEGGKRRERGQKELEGEEGRGGNHIRTQTLQQ